MHEHPASADRREALKARHRRAIIDAASALMNEISGTGFTVDQLAERADVSRRTVFNHFGSLDDVVLEVFGEMLGTVVRDIDAALACHADGPSTGLPMFDQVTGALRAVDLVSSVIEFTRIFDTEHALATPRQEVLFNRAINELGTRISETVLRHHPSADAFDVEVMCGALVSGALAAHRHWRSATGGVDTPDSRRVWNTLLDRALAMARSGYGTHDRGST